MVMSKLAHHCRQQENRCIYSNYIYNNESNLQMALASFKPFLCFSLLGALLSLILDDSLLANGNIEVPFDQNYKVAWGETHASTIDNGREIQLSMDASSGACL